jgi:CHAT domain-containing protein
VPTVRGLAHARRPRPARLPDRPPRTLVVAVPDGLEQAPLPAARREAGVVGRRFDRGELLCGTEATVNAVVARLPGVACLHLACHGEQT